MRIAIAGGTGTVGRHTLDVAREHGHEVVVLARSTGVDLVDGTGVADALAEVDTVIDVTSVQTRDAGESRAFFGAVTRTLLDAGRVAGVGHHILLSIVGIDASPHDYYAGKVLQEQLVSTEEVPFSILRATQFHEFAAQIHGAVTVGPVVLVPVMRSQPIAAREVAEALIELAHTGASGRVTDLAGPRVESIAHMVRAYASAIGDRRPIAAVPLPGPGGRAMRDGTLLAAAGARIGRQTFAEWVADVRPGFRP